MSKLEKSRVELLAPDEPASFRRWLAEYNAANWDAQIEADARAGRLDAMAEKALADHRGGGLGLFQGSRCVPASPPVNKFIPSKISSLH